jgi:hypothetical protein
MSTKWHALPYGALDFRISSDGRDTIATVDGASPHAEKRAQLLAAAPELREALAALVTASDGPRGTPLPFGRARALLARLEEA